MALEDDDPVEVYRREIATVSPLTKDEEAHLFQEARQLGERGEVAKRRLIESHLHLVLPVAERHTSGRLSMLELIQEGNLGLTRALESFQKPISTTFRLMPLPASRASSPMP
jgi:DNA-directed RNA polymerase sigma subunit (sigma70/sigma32)